MQLRAAKILEEKTILRLSWRLNGREETVKGFQDVEVQ